jgi:hypothetical protein
VTAPVFPRSGAVSAPGEPARPGRNEGSRHSAMRTRQARLPVYGEGPCLAGEEFAVMTATATLGIRGGKFGAMQPGRHAGSQGAYPIFACGP